MKEIREGNIFIYKLCICIKSRTHYTPKTKLRHWHTRTGMSLYRNTRHTTAVMNDLVQGVKRVTFTQEGFDASGAQRLSCGRFRSVWKKKTVFQRRASAVRRCGTVYKKRRVSRRCAVCYPMRGRRRKKQEKASDPRRKSKSLSRIYVCTTDSGKGKWCGVVPRGESLRTICIKKTEKVKLGETRDIVRDDCAKRVLDCDFFFVARYIILILIVHYFGCL